MGVAVKLLLVPERPRPYRGALPRDGMAAPRSET